MFGKLLKYEFRCYFKSLLPLWGAAILLSVINGFTLPRAEMQEVVGSNAFFTFVLPLMLFGCAFAAMGIVVLVLTLQRFYQGLLGNEGYLMFTLPVSRSQLIASKLLVSMVAQLLSGVVVLLCVFILGVILGRNAFLSFIPKALQLYIDLFREHPEFTGTLTLLCVECAVLLLLSMAGNALHLYAAMALGHLSKKQKIAASVLAWLGLNVALKTVGSKLLTLLFGRRLTDLLRAQEVQDLLPLLLVIILCVALLDAVYWAISEIILERKLNLE